MKQILASILLISGLSQTAWAEPIAQIGAQITWEHHAQERQFRTRTPWTARGGWVFDQWDALVEYTSFYEAGGAGNLSVERRNHAWIGWGRRRFPKVTGAGFPVIPFFAVGLGFQYNRVRTHFMSETLISDGRPHPLIAAASGVMVEIEDDLEVGLELRISASQNYRPNPLYGGLFLVGYRF